MKPDKTEGFRRLLRLMSQSEQETFRDEFGIAKDASEDETLEVLARLPRYEAVRAFLRAADATLDLLREVLETLQNFGFATRTTGCIFVLGNPANPAERTELTFSPQTVNAICQWPQRKKWKRLSVTVEELLSTWRRMEPMWSSLYGEAESRVTEGDIDFVETAIKGEIVYESDTDEGDENAQRLLHYFTSRAKQMADRLAEISDEVRPPELTEIISCIGILDEEVAQCLRNSRFRQCQGLGEPVEPPDDDLIDRYIPREFISTFDKFIEDVYSLADLIPAEDSVDMLQIDLWSSRPQLFEIWVLTTLLRWLSGRGYGIEFLKNENVTGDAAFRWNLVYSKESEPCAAISHSDGPKQFLFYQLYRPSGDMPDISLLEKSEPSSDPIWSVDPKHSQQGAYSLRDYRKTATRYRDSFGAKRSLIVEYFDRPELGQENPIEFGANAKLIRECRPSGAGLPILIAELAEFHPSYGKVLVCIDCSGSFDSGRASILEAFRSNARKRGRVFADDYICFAGTARVCSNFNAWLSLEVDLDLERLDLRPGTAADPLFDAIAQVKRTSNITEIILISDGQFDDVPIDRVVDHIASQFGARVDLFEPQD